MEIEKLFHELFYEEISDMSTSSDSLSDSSFEEFYKKKRKRVPKKVNKYVQEKVLDPDYAEDIVTTFTEEEFKDQFHVSIEVAQHLSDRITAADILPQQNHGRKNISPWKAVVITLSYLSSKDSFKFLAEKFNTSSSCAWAIVRKIVEYLVLISSEFIIFPRQELSDDITEKFYDLEGMRGVAGVIGITYVEIKTNNNKQYVNSAGEYTVVLQAVVDPEYRFTDIYCGEPGSKTETEVLQESPLFKMSLENPNFLGDNFFVGYAGYPTLRWLFPQFSGDLTDQQVSFNQKHAATSQVLSSAFTLLRNRFQRFTCFESSDIKFISNCVVAACVLHNICIMYLDDYEPMHCNVNQAIVAMEMELMEEDQ